MLRRLRIRAKLTLVSAIPVTCLLGVVVAAGLSASRSISTAAEVAGAARRSGVIGEFVHELQRERGLSAGLVGGGFQAADRQRVDTQRKVVDDARRRLDDAVTGAPAGSPLADARARLDLLADHRGAVDGRGFGVTAVLGWYNDTIEQLLRASTSLTAAAPGTQLLAQITAQTALARTKEAAALEWGLVNGVLAQGSFQPDHYRDLLTLIGARQAQREIFDSVAGPGRRDELVAVATMPESIRAAEMERQAVARPNERLAMRPSEWWDVMTARIDRYHEIEQHLAADVVATADADVAQARLQWALVVGGGLALVAATAAAVTVIARSILRPVAALTDRAHRIADDDLPRVIGALQDAAGEPVAEELPPVAVESEDELAGLATAFNSVQRVAVDLAVEQALLRHNVAEMFINLGRRNQALIGRQLAFIDRLEQGEVDPEQLEKLFRLDHMSTRMRRNAESLLVLAGAELPQRWASPVPVADVVRAGLSEIEDYPRVDLGELPPVDIAGAVATDLTHLLAELMENATMFSPPSTRVEVHGTQRADSYLLAVVDHGIGMTAEQLAEANDRIDELARFDRSPSRTLGLYVVGRLAARHGISVRLVESATAGLTAKVLVPAAALLPPPPPPPPPIPERVGSVSGPSLVGAAAGEGSLAHRPRPTPPAVAGESFRQLRRRLRSAQLPDTGPPTSAPL